MKYNLTGFYFILWDVLILFRSGETVMEEKHLVLDGVAPVWPVVLSGARVEIMRDAFCKQFLVEIAVYFVEEVFRAAVNDDL